MPVADLPLLIEAAHHAAEIALKYWQTDQRVDYKDGGSPVSEGDLAVDAYLRETLLAARPGYGWLSEETEDDHARLTHDTVFIVDPIDGTRAYVDGQKTWAHSIAVAHKGQPTAGVVFLPLRDKLYTATTGQGAFLNGEIIRCASRTDPNGADILAPRASLDAQWWRGDVPAFQRHFRSSLAYRFCLIADGRFDAMLTLRDAWEWDIAAGILIAAEGGAKVTDRKGEAITLNSRKAQSSGILTANTALHRAIGNRL
ncbi:MAG: 3'(2'),5'-bisphosphate nucleotidase CysQ [Rhodobacter sp.]|nr:3'(2'),5'-bisphosphate nucleotidase CysQ [Rhodobacter sp.]